MHARLQNMTYSFKLKVKVGLQVYIAGKSEKANSGKDSYICRKVLSEAKRETIVGLDLMIRGLILT